MQAQTYLLTLIMLIIQATDGAPTPLPPSELAPPPKDDDIFADIAELKDKHEKELKEYHKAQV